MKRVAVFGNAGGGKSTLARQLAESSGLPLYSIDKVKHLPGGGDIPEPEYRKLHDELLRSDEWIIDGFGCVTTAWERFACADTLVYVDLSLARHFFWVSKRLVKGLFINPEGWPQNSPILRGSMNSYRVLWPCHSRLTPRYRELVRDMSRSKCVHHLKTPQAIPHFLSTL